MTALIGKNDPTQWFCKACFYAPVGRGKSNPYGNAGNLTAEQAAEQVAEHNRIFHGGTA